ncbi:MAG: DNA polymerase III subunit beta [Thermoflexibacter sp.]|jgi:DNA polymerase-3 subunit beta|nr:DNA polymerase III subunit beta [Thermoflexibacter sp.]
MKFIIASSTLLKQLTALNGVIVSNPVVPILENFLFEIKDGMLMITASDLQTSVTAQVSVDADEDGGVAIPAKMLIETLRNLPEQPVTFKVDEDTYSVEIISENGHYKLAGENATDFPKVPEIKQGQSVELSSELVNTAIAYTLFAVSTDEMKPAMNGVYVNIKEGKATFVSTDSHRLIRYVRTDISSSGSETAIIIPRKALTMLKNTLPMDNTPLTLSFNKSNAYFSFGNMNMICRLIDERFPDYENVIPINNSNILEIDRLEFVGSLKRMSIYANKSTNQVRLKLSNNSLEISAEDIDFSNEANEKLHCEYTTDELEIGFNAKFLIEGLSNVAARHVIFKFSEPNRAAIMTPTDVDASEDLMMLIMPVMLNSYY